MVERLDIGCGGGDSQCTLRRRVDAVGNGNESCKKDPKETTLAYCCNRVFNSLYIRCTLMPWLPQSHKLLLYSYAAAFLVISYLVHASYRQDQRISGSWGCEMSWMTPSYIPIQLNPGGYSLYLYREQGWDTDEHVSRPRFAGLTSHSSGLVTP
jgi:hypothetical protein